MNLITRPLPHVQKTIEQSENENCTEKMRDFEICAELIIVAIIAAITAVIFFLGLANAIQQQEVKREAIRKNGVDQKSDLP